ncbi:hypothetical protein FS837_005363 [Tulasnella sp. UAMH 9824]|nr:hypothetical protein FS837_005363 [Tulasnella sp. UAMH 9824]
MFFTQRPVSRVPQHTYRPDYYQQSPQERYYREIAEEHNRRAELALRLAQQERQRALRERELQAVRARQYQEQLARRSQYAPQLVNRRGSQLYNIPQSAPAFDLVLSFANEPPRSYPIHPVHRPQPSEARHFASRRPTSFFEHLIQALDASPEPESERPAKRVRFGPEQATSTPHPQPTKQDKGKARASVQEESIRLQGQDVRKPVNPAPFWDFFGGLQALQEEDAIVRQFNLFGERSFPGVAQQGVAGPSGTKHSKPAESSNSSAPSASASRSTAKPAIPVPINTTAPAPSTPSSTASSPKSHVDSFTSLDAIQSRFDALKSSFVFPTTLQFESAAATSSEVPRLSYSSSNTSIHEYENELTKLLTKLDAVESDGAESIRGARKALVVAVEKELDELEAEKKTAWRTSLVEADVAATASESDTVPEAPSEPREDVSEAESTWVAPVPTAGEEVRGYDVFGPVVELPVPSAGEESEPTKVSLTAPVRENQIIPSDSITEAEVADPAAKEEVETPAPVAEAPVEDRTVSALEASEQVPIVQGQPTDSDSESDIEATELAGEREDSDPEAEPFVDVQQASPVVSEASLGEFDNAALIEETTKEPLKDSDAHASDDEFEML